MIKAGTSEKGVCPACGKSWKRVIERGECQVTEAMRIAGCDKDGNYYGKETKDYVSSGSQEPSETKRRILESMSHPIKTLGWQPTCKCEKEPIPATVLDPFMGSGTTLLVARKLLREGIGIELNPEYIKLAEKRLNKIPERLDSYESK
ncbi:MAG: site-specific DNA-methyltransferase [Gammaproteobacteria bacterium]|nr:site-specific DNA-methyltransferase [Gammaproteobacteria bacterium]